MKSARRKPERKKLACPLLRIHTGEAAQSDICCCYEPSINANDTLPGRENSCISLLISAPLRLLKKLERQSCHAFSVGSAARRCRDKDNLWSCRVCKQREDKDKNKNNSRAEVSLNNACLTVYCTVCSTVSHSACPHCAWLSSFVTLMWDFSGKRSICSFQSQ